MNIIVKYFRKFGIKIPYDVLEYDKLRINNNYEILLII